MSNNRAFRYDGQTYLLWNAMLRTNGYMLRYSPPARFVLVWLTLAFLSVGIVVCLFAARLFEKNKQLDEMRIAFIRGAAHELKTPLAVICSRCECLLEQVAPEKNDAYLASIHAEAERMNEIILQFLRYNSLFADTSFVKTQVCVSNIVAAESEKYRPFAQSRDVGLVAEIAPDIHAVCNAELLGLAVDNYLSNAVRFARAGGAVRVSLRLLSDTAICAVYNDGDPIPDDEKTKIWEPLYRTDAARTADGTATGIGLATNRRIFHLHGYKYGFKNERSGVRFYFEISPATHVSSV